MLSTLNTQDVTAVGRGSPALLYPTLLIVGIAVIIVSMLGIAAMTGVLPQAQSQAVDARVAGGNEGKTAAQARTGDRKTVPANVSASVLAKTGSSKTALPAVAAARCADCGVVDSVRAVEVKGEGSGVGAVAGSVLDGVLGNQVGGSAGAYAGNEVRKNMKKNVSYEIRVRMDDNSYRTIHAAQPDVGVGQRVKVRDGQLADAG